LEDDRLQFPLYCLIFCALEVPPNVRIYAENSQFRWNDNHLTLNQSESDPFNQAPSPSVLLPPPPHKHRFILTLITTAVMQLC
jgi:hypothetical protein